MKQKDWLQVLVLLLVVLLIYHPLFYTDYVYTDEVVQLWMYRKGSDFTMFMAQGRYITEKLFQSLFSSIESISEIKYIRLFSLISWMLCIPVWYTVINKVVEREGLPKLLVFTSMLYLICMPSFTIYVQWASCLELFIANTSGLLAGYILYNGINTKDTQIRIAPVSIALSVLLGVVSLFTYQAGFGCFILPFVLHLIAKPQSYKPVFTAIGIYTFTYLLYFVLFKLQIQSNGFIASDRTSIYIAPIEKLLFLFTRPLAGAFHFTYLFNEKDLTGYILYAVLFAAWLSITFIRYKNLSISNRFPFFLLLFLLFILAYTPGLVVRENYASNRTLFALNMIVYFLVAETIIFYLKRVRLQQMIFGVICILFFINAWYNFRFLFLNPVKKEYDVVRHYIETNYKIGITKVYFIRPQEDHFVNHFGITRSWDEFGVPSTFFEWVPEFLVKQLIFEKTGDRAKANTLVIEHWLGRDVYLKSGKVISDNIMLVDVEAILNQSKVK